MYFSSILSTLAALAIPVAGLSGQATTTRYGGGTGGACGCGMDGNWRWQLGMSAGVYTAAGSQSLFDTAGTGTGWCGGGCGTCYKLTSTGTSATGGPAAAGQSITVMLTNYCPPGDGNEEWCPSKGSNNAHGFGYHFDLMAENIIFGDNAIVNFAQVPCPSSASSMWPTCQCSSMVTPPMVDDSPQPPTSSSPGTSPSSTSTAVSTTPTKIKQTDPSDGDEPSACPV